MKGVKEIWFMIEDARQEIVDIENDDPASLRMNILSVKKEKLKNHLEEIRQNLEGLLFSWDSGVVRKACLFFLEEILGISERLGQSYLIPGYSESYYIMDTIKIAENV